jgi:phage antirepressor YoqD-like protein
MPERPLLCSVIDGAKMLGIGRSAMYEILSSHQILSVKMGKRRLCLVSSIESYVESLLLSALKSSEAITAIGKV